MFGPGFETCWYAVSGVPGLEMSGDLRFRGPGGERRMRHDRNGRPHVQARRKSSSPGAGRLRERRVLLHRAVMSVLGRELASGEMVCHRDDDKRNNWPENLYLGDAMSNAADSIRNGRRPTGERHPQAKLSDEQVRTIRRDLARGVRGDFLAAEFGVHKTTVSRIKHGVRRRAG